MLVLENVTKRFGGLIAVNGVSATFDAGSITAIIGPNGAGKTTLFEMIAGAVAPTAGRIVFEGRELTGRRADEVCRAGIGRTFQIVKPFWHLTVRDHVCAAILFGSARTKEDVKKSVSTPNSTTPNSQSALFRRDLFGNWTFGRWELSHFFTRSKVRAYVREKDLAREKDLVGPSFSSGATDVLKLTGLTHRSDEPARNLTLADCRRLEIARALATGATLILLDETMAGLTPEETRDAIALVKRVRDSGRTVILIEHVLPAVTGLAERALVLDRGSVIADGAPRVVLASAAVRKAYLGEEH